MFNLIGNLKYKYKKSKTTTISKKDIKEGINVHKDYIIKFKRNEIIAYDRNCDHLGGKIISKNDQHICPLHSWKFYPETGKYENGIKKQKKIFKLKDNKIIIKENKLFPEITKFDTNEKIKIRFFNHAFFQIESKDIKFATDPWAIGPAFNTGWWLKNKTKNDWHEELNSCSFIYISHNHPDHLHPLTLSKVRKNMPIIVPNFVSDSTGRYLESLGFKNIQRLEFQKEYQFKKTNLIISFLKSGDFREDSGIYFSIGKTTFLFDVDSNMVNFNKLPKVDVYASSFAGGAGGYPLMFDNYSKETQIQISKKDKKITKIQKEKRIKEIKPKYFIPYAGFFVNKLTRDKRIKDLNEKNQIHDYEKTCKKLDVEILNVEKNDEFYFDNSLIIKKVKNKSDFFKDISSVKYLEFFKKEYDKVDLKFIENYFKVSKFKDNLVLYMSLTNDNFKSSYLHFKVDFSNKIIKFEVMGKINLNNTLGKKNYSQKVLYLKCRKESFLNTIYNNCPWEDLLIGFQCKVLRYPNLYNLKFWYHFTNIYIGKKNTRYSSDCSSCDKFLQFIDNQIYSETINSRERKLV